MERCVRRFALLCLVLKLGTVAAAGDSNLIRDPGLESSDRLGRKGSANR